MVALAWSLSCGTAASAATSTIGRTWPIAEPDALTEIETKAAALPRDLAPKFGPRSGWSAMKAASLGPVVTTRTRQVVPFYTLDADIVLPEGRVLFRKGYTFNPLAYVSLPQRLVIVHAAELDWALRTASPTDWILLAGGGAANPDPIALGSRVGRALFLLEDRVKVRLGLSVAPVVVRQVGQALELSEIKPPKASGAM
ncbi:conjugal transfer protein TraW [Sphingomonas sp. BIUV-7]|uniref:Conjugal transfer protein TraW n=1 Tax=Sphingomonas natans TaxID=3063330 RepID=A0ABT8YAS1_9SPHN|nr:conjugal transfer protein TraW [Sphingomonas sp. BIUV-7]MDO6415442.1 conjugal transfer protein TraW [Sphingomonas sp. BIUV-7]